MADAEEEFSAEGIRQFIISRGGRVKNVELVGHYKKYLNDPAKKGRILTGKKHATSMFMLV